MNQPALPAGVAVKAPRPPLSTADEGAASDGILTADAVGFLAALHRRFAPQVAGLLRRRAEVQAKLDGGAKLDFLAETRDIRAGDWQVAPLPADLLDRRVELTGPVDRKMVINALNSGARVSMADFEDATTPTWDNLLHGQQNLYDAIRRTIEFTAADTGKRYRLHDKVAVLMVRPRGWHLYERHFTVDGAEIPGGLFDFGLYFFHNAKELLRRGSGPYFYLPKLESHLEARLWNEVFLFAQEALGLPVGTIKATVLIETLPAAFEMDEILYELRQHSAGLNCGRWDYIFSFIKKHRADPQAILPDRSQVTMDKAFLQAYSLLLIKTCHRRGVHAMGGMAAVIPIKDDPAANSAAMAKVSADKLREVQNGHDGTWVAHPGLVALAQAIFDEHMPAQNQLDQLRRDVEVGQADLLAIPPGSRSEEGLRHNIRVGVQYLEAWLRGQGCVPLYNLMEDAATAEISRAQVWQWIHHRAPLHDGSIVSLERLQAVLAEELHRIGREVGPDRYAHGRFADAAQLFSRLVSSAQFEEFLTVPAYRMLDPQTP